jgi:membrane protease YdiL (CAAX protease family)
MLAIVFPVDSRQMRGYARSGVFAFWRPIGYATESEAQHQKSIIQTRAAVPNAEEILTELAGWFALALFCGLFLIYVRAVREGPQFLPPQRHRAIPWTGLEVCLVALVYFLVPAFVLAALRQTRAFELLYGIDLESALDASATEEVRESAMDRLSLWVPALAFPFQVAAMLFLLYSVSGTRPYQLGLTKHRAAANVYLGAKYWLLWTPVVIVLNAAVNLIYPLLTRQAPQEHPVTRLIHGPHLWVDWLVVVIVALAAAPFLEELVFRGILQPWFSRRSWGGAAAMAAAFGFALLSQVNTLYDTNKKGDFGGFFLALAPSLFVLVLVPGYFGADRLAKRFFPKFSSGPTSLHENVARGWYGTAVLFAAVHSNVWPSPIPLFVLALVLGWLAYRTQSLVGPILLHVLFNGVACVSLILTQVAASPEKEKGKADTTAGRRPAAVSTSTTVPGSWLPRRR